MNDSGGNSNSKKENRLKNSLASLVIACSLYSIMPVPQLTWTEARLRHVLAWFPLVGWFNALWDIGWFVVWRALNVSPFLLTLLLLIGHYIFRGAIHLDGYCDTADALFSRRSKEERLRIMQDPQIGSFATIALFFLLMLQTGLWLAVVRRLITLSWLGLPDGDELASVQLMLFWLGLSVFIRALSALQLLIVRTARPGGLGDLLTSGAQKADRYALYFWHSLSAVLMLIGLPSAAVPVIVLSWLMWFVLTRWCLRRLGGTTGDLAGFFLTVSELLAGFTLYFVVR